MPGQDEEDRAEPRRVAPERLADRGAEGRLPDHGQERRRVREGRGELVVLRSFGEFLAYARVLVTYRM